MVAGKIANMPSHRPIAGSALIQAVSQPEAAKKLNVGRDSVQKAKKVISEAEPEVIAAVESGTMAVSANLQIPTSNSANLPNSTPI